MMASSRTARRTSSERRRCKDCSNFLASDHSLDLCSVCQRKQAEEQWFKPVEKRGEGADGRTDLRERSVPLDEPKASPKEEPAPRDIWAGRSFKQAEELAAEASKLTGKVITAADVDDLIEYSPAYDGKDLRVIVEAYGGIRDPRPKRAVAERLLQLRQLIVEAGPEASAPLPPREDLSYEIEDRIDDFLATLKLGLTGDDWLEAREFVYPALDTTTEPEVALQKVVANLRTRCPKWPPPDPLDKARDAFSAVWSECKVAEDMELEYGRRWRKAHRIAGKMVNRGKKRTGRSRTRRFRRRYVAEMIFDYLCFRAPISEKDLDDAWGWKILSKKGKALRRALEDAAASLTPPRKAKHIIGDAYEGPSDSDLRNNFRRRVYRYISESPSRKLWWERLRAGKLPR